MSKLNSWQDWIKKCSINNKVAWHPYVLSLRIINICKLNINNEIISKNLYQQTSFLYKNLEYYHPANHYLENARALIFAGIFFNRLGEADKWFVKGIEIYEKEIHKQVLADGVYFEKSVMYHAIILGKEYLIS